MCGTGVVVLDAGAVKFVYSDCARIEVLETVEVDHVHVVAFTVVTVAVGLDATGFAEGVVDVVFVEMVGGLLVFTTEEREVFFWYKREQKTFTFAV